MQIYISWCIFNSIASRYSN